MFICQQQPIGFPKRQRLLTEPPFYIAYTRLSTKQNITESALGILAEAMRVTIARSWTQFQVNQHQLITSRQIEMAVATEVSNLMLLVDMHSIGLVRVKECLTFFTFDTPYLNAFVILTDNTLTAIWIDETGGDGVRLLDMFTHITLGMVNMVTKLKLPSNLLCGGWRVRKGSGLLTVLISQRHIERVFT